MDLRLPSSVKSVVQIETGEMGARRVRTLKKEKKRKKKGTQGFSEIERVVRLLTEGTQAVTEKYLDRHNSSNRKKQDGWFRDLGYNMLTADREGLKKILKIFRL